jgi:hypothetical protein
LRIHDLRSHRHADLSDHVVHFTGRNGTHVEEIPKEILDISPEQRLVEILRDGEIRAFPAFDGMNEPVACFSESTHAGVCSLVAAARYDPYGIGFQKNVIFRAGGGPAFYVRGDEWQHAYAMAEAIRFRAVRFWPGASGSPGEVLPDFLAGESDWLHEREWRVRGPFRFTLDDVAFVVVADKKGKRRIMDFWREFYGPGEELAIRGIAAIVIAKDGTVLSDEAGLWSAEGRR